MDYAMCYEPENEFIMEWREDISVYASAWTSAGRSFLSSYLFVLCMERLCHQIEFAFTNQEWKPIRLSRGGPSLSHVCFADDLILFAGASISQIRVIRKVLERFCRASGQKVSLEKSLIFFSENVHRDLATR